MADQNEGKDDELVQKNVAFYQAFLSAWIENRMEKDKQILTLSALAIGLLVTFRKELCDTLEFSIWLGAGLAYLASIGLVLRIFGQNSDYIEKILNDDDTGAGVELEKSLQKNTFWAGMLFVVGVILTGILAILGTGFIITKGA